MTTASLQHPPQAEQEETEQQRTTGKNTHQETNDQRQVDKEEMAVLEAELWALVRLLVASFELGGRYDRVLALLAGQDVPEESVRLSHADLEQLDRDGLEAEKAATRAAFTRVHRAIAALIIAIDAQMPDPPLSGPLQLRVNLCALALDVFLRYHARPSSRSDWHCRRHRYDNCIACLTLYEPTMIDFNGSLIDVRKKTRGGLFRAASKFAHLLVDASELLRGRGHDHALVWPCFRLLLDLKTHAVYERVYCDVKSCQSALTTLFNHDNDPEEFNSISHKSALDKYHELLKTTKDELPDSIKSVYTEGNEDPCHQPLVSMSLRDFEYEMKRFIEMISSYLDKVNIELLNPSFDSVMEYLKQEEANLQEKDQEGSLDENSQEQEEQEVAKDDDENQENQSDIASPPDAKRWKGKEKMAIDFEIVSGSEDEADMLGEEFRRQEQLDLIDMGVQIGTWPPSVDDIDKVLCPGLPEKEELVDDSEKEATDKLNSPLPSRRASINKLFQIPHVSDSPVRSQNEVAADAKDDSNDSISLEPDDMLIQSQLNASLQPITYVDDDHAQPINWTQVIVPDPSIESEEEQQDEVSRPIVPENEPQPIENEAEGQEGSQEKADFSVQTEANNGLEETVDDSDIEVEIIRRRISTGEILARTVKRRRVVVNDELPKRKKVTFGQEQEGDIEKEQNESEPEKRSDSLDENDQMPQFQTQDVSQFQTQDHSLFPLPETQEAFDLNSEIGSANDEPEKEVEQQITQPETTGVNDDELQREPEINDNELPNDVEPDATQLDTEINDKEKEAANLQTISVFDLDTQGNLVNAGETQIVMPEIDTDAEPTHPAEPQDEPEQVSALTSPVRNQQPRPVSSPCIEITGNETAVPRPVIQFREPNIDPIEAPHNSNQDENNHEAANDNRSTTSTSVNRRISAASTSSSTHGRRARIQWTPDEVAALEEGIRRYKSGWAMIHAEFRRRFHPSRSQVDLKDKARNERKRRERTGEDLGVWGCY